MRPILIIIALLAIHLLSVAQTGKLVDKIVGVVSDDIILLSDIEIQYQQYKSQGEATPNMKCQLLDQSLMEKLFLSQAIIDSVVVSEDEVESELERRIRYFISMFGSSEKLEEYYGKSVLALKEEFREDISDQLLAQKMQQQVFSGMNITPAEVKQFYAEIPEDSLPYFNAEVELAHIVIFPKVSDAQKQYAKDKINEIRDRIINDGADFGFQAFSYSEDPGSKDEYGDLGYIQRGEMVREFEAAAFRLDEKEVSEIVETEFGYHLIYVEEKKGDRLKVKHILIRPKVTSFELQAAKKKCDSIHLQIIGDTITFDQGVKMYSEEEGADGNNGMLQNPNTGTAWFEMSEIEGTLTFYLDEMEVGDVSKPLEYVTPDGKNAYRLVYLRNETEAHQADLKQDYTRIRAAALQRKQARRLVEWVKLKRGETYIFVDDAFKDCREMAKWTAKN